jgi:signal peptidase I
LIKPIVGVAAIAAVLCIAFGFWWFLSAMHRTYSFCTETFSIPSAAMQPTLKIGDLICVDRTRYGSHDPADGDIVVFSPPADLGKTAFIKRVVGSPGDTIEIRQGRLYRNGKNVEEPYVSAPANYSLKVEGFGIYVDGSPLIRSYIDIPPKISWKRPDRIPKGYYLVLGDNRINSNDSHLFGFVRRDQLWGRATKIYWPLSRARSLVP